MTKNTLVQSYRRDGFIHLSIENAFIKATFLPEIGGKMIELSNKKSGRQFLLEPQTANGLYQRPCYGAVFDDYDTSGFDECFPTVAASKYCITENDHKREIDLPDHGELWSRRWDYELSHQEIKFMIDGIQLKYHFEKRVQLEGNSLLLNYSLTNQAPMTFHYIWAAHPLLRVRPGTRLFFKDKIEEVLLQWSSDDFLGSTGEMRPWPYLSHHHPPIDYSLVQPKILGRAVKCFTNALEQGMAGLYYHHNDETLLLEFDPIHNPYLGIWMCYGGWPPDQTRKHLTVALEPASGRPDSLQEAMERNECATINPIESKSWFLKFTLTKGKPKFLTID